MGKRTKRAREEGYAEGYEKGLNVGATTALAAFFTVAEQGYTAESVAAAFGIEPSHDETKFAPDVIKALKTSLSEAEKVYTVFFAIQEGAIAPVPGAAAGGGYL